MSSRFYNYLSEKIINYFRLNIPRAGDKFYVQFETDRQVRDLYEVLKCNTLQSPFSYLDDRRGQRYDTYQLKFQDTSLLVAASMEGGPHPDFLATLRNLVGLEKGYEHAAILFIHSSSLDSILGGAGNLSKEGMPLNIDVIKRDIERKIRETGFSSTDKEILAQYLENKSKEMEGAPASVFEYGDIINILGNSQITSDEYSRFELFPDDQLEALTGKKLRMRLDENHQNYVRVSEIHSYGLDEEKLEKFYGENGAKRLKKEDWTQVKYSEILKFMEDKKDKSSIEYYPVMNRPDIWDKEEGMTRAQSRIRNIIIFYDGQEAEYNLTLSFSEYTKYANVEVAENYKPLLQWYSAGKRLQVNLKNCLEPASFYRLKYRERNARFEFRIAVLRCGKVLLEGIKTQYSVKIDKKPERSVIQIVTEEDEVVFNPHAEKLRKEIIQDPDQVISLDKAEGVKVSIGEEYPEPEDHEDIRFVVSRGEFHVRMTKAYAADKSVVIDGMKLWYLKCTRKMDFEIAGENRLIFGTKKYYARDEYKKILSMEKRYVELGSPCLAERTEGAYESVPLALPEKVRDCFDEIIAYYRRAGGIPGLTCLNSDIKKLYVDYLNAVREEIDGIQEGGYLNETQKGLFGLGMIKRSYGDRELFLTPLHPINIAYQVFISETDISGLEEDEIQLMRRFQQTSLLPYINIDPLTGENKIYIPFEQAYAPEWKVYVEETLPRYKGSKDFVSKLVSEKIREFVEHFSYLFAKGSDAPVRINLINTGDCREIVQGIIRYYVRALNASEQIIPIRVTMYSERRMDNAFERMSQIEDVGELVSVLGLEIRVDEMRAEEVIDLYRKKVHFFKKNLEEFDYAHITFMELDDNHQAINTQMKDIPTGVVMNGLSSGVPSARLGDSYRTGFGTKYVDVDSALIDLAAKYNALNAAMNGGSYRRGSCEALKMNSQKEHMLDKVYDAGNWVTFINPKVDLSYFKSDPDARDLLIIHYTDQFNQTSSGYDAITVTKKSKQYQDAVSRYLLKNGVEDAQSHARRIINMFNALNGDWLVRMLSYKSQFPIEKLSILSAVKLAVKRYAADGVIWVPISLEEIFRVSGAAGLSSKESVFSARNLGFEGMTSDDLLLVGIKNAEPVQVTFYPIEVKIGQVETVSLEKGLRQVLKTREIFDEILGNGICKDKDIRTRLYRNFFMQQVIVNAGKLLLYEVGDGRQGWDLITDSELRRMLLSEEYEVVESLIPEMGKAGLFAFKDGSVKEKEYRVKDVLFVEKPRREGINLLARSFDEIDTVQWNLVEEVQNLGEIADGDDGEDQLCPDVRKDPEPPADVPSSDAGQSNDGIRVLIGRDKYGQDVYWEFGSKALANRHLLITGISGQGKTYSIQAMLYELEARNISSVIFDYTEGFMQQHLEPPFKDALKDRLSQNIVYNSGVPINPFRRHEVELAGTKILEKESDVAARLANIFEHVYNYGAQQSSAVFEAIFNGLREHGDRMNMRYFQQELEEVAESNKAARSVISKMLPFFRTVDFTEDPDFDWGNILYAKEAGVHIVQLTMFSRDMQVIITEMMLWDAWYYTKKYGSKDKPFVVVLDEAHNLSLAMKSPGATILTEGRKFGWSAWFATQSLKVLREEEVVYLRQAAFKLYFKPTDDEMVKIAKQIDAAGEGNWLTEIQNLKKGQCIVTGDRRKADGKVGPSAPVVTDVAAIEERNLSEP